MRLLLPPIALATTLIVPALADASPFAIPVGPSVRVYEVEPPADDPDLATDDAEDASELDEQADEVPTGDDEAVDESLGDPTEGEDDEDEDEVALPTGKPKNGDFNANAMFLQGGIHLVPSYFLNQALASYSNSLCRNKVGKWGEENGLVKVDGCNYYVGGGYLRRISRAFDVSVGLGYLHIQPPDSLWIDNDEWDRDSCTVDGGGASTCNLGAADYTSIDLRMFTVDVNFIGRGTLYRNADVEIQLGGGGGIGVGVLIGSGVARTPLGPNPSGYSDGMQTPGSCTTLADTADFRRCTPRYFDDIDIDQDGDGLVADVSREMVDMGAALPKGNATSTGTSFARCSEHKCSGSDMEMFGATETGGTWPAYPLINILGSFRVIIKDSFGINIEGGIKTGFFFGGGISYFFGGGGKDK
jgi:hypothetical protein